MLAAAALLLAAPGCASSATPDGSSVAPTATPTGTTSHDQASDTLSETDVQALLIAGRPETLTWLMTGTPTDWQQVEGDPGTTVWHVGDSACSVNVVNVGGYGTSENPQSREVAREFIGRLVEGIGSEPRFTDEPDQPFPLRVITDEGAADGQTAFATTHVTDASGELEGFSLGFRDNSDVGLAVFALCGQGDFPDHEDSMREFVKNNLAVEMTF
ncbi:hypothetical protein [Promicromonospora umidemergens]|uniref:hypothetical protein n=1 Tax=Promicromonospora umidemergens TaxID=629679 RepID=UPI0020A538CB|nr:hypothetical protein [Promicromonospora umidemergens]